MGITSGTHWLVVPINLVSCAGFNILTHQRVGVFLLFASSVLLLITTISAPVLNDVGLLRVTLQNETNFRHSSVSFGTFGYCILDVPPDK